MKSKYIRYPDKSLNIKKIIQEIYGAYFQRHSNRHKVYWDFERESTIFGKEKLKLHIYSDCPGIIIGYKGVDINKLKERLKKEANIDIVVVHDCEHL